MRRSTADRINYSAMKRLLAGAAGSAGWPSVLLRGVLTGLSSLLMAGAAFAFDPAPAPARIGVLRPAQTYAFDREAIIQRTVLDALGEELRSRGFDAYEVEETFSEIELDADRDADYYVEIIGGGEGESIDYGGIGVGGRHADVSFGLIVSRVAAELRVYDGRTLETLAVEKLDRKSRAVLPTSIGLGGRAFFAVIAMPFIERTQIRNVARAAGRDAGGRVATAVREQ